MMSPNLTPPAVQLALVRARRITRVPARISFARLHLRFFVVSAALTMMLMTAPVQANVV
jgi:hypothetical protein